MTPADGNDVHVAIAIQIKSLRAIMIDINDWFSPWLRRAYFINIDFKVFIRVSLGNNLSEKITVKWFSKISFPITAEKFQLLI